MDIEGALLEHAEKVDMVIIRVPKDITGLAVAAFASTKLWNSCVNSEKGECIQIQQCIGKFAVLACIVVDDKGKLRDVS